MPRLFLAIAMAGIALCGCAMAGSPVEIDGVQQTYTVTAGTADTTYAGSDFVVTSSGGSNGALEIAAGGSGTGTSWSARSITLTSGDTASKGIFKLGGGDNITIKLSGRLTIDGNDTIGGEMNVTGTNGVLYAAGGVFITGTGKLVIDLGAALDADNTSFTINSARSDSAIDLQDNGKLILRSLDFQAGLLKLGDAGSTFEVDGDAVVGGHQAEGAMGCSTANLALIGGGSVTFHDGLTIREGGTVASDSAAGAFSLGYGKTLTLAGGTLLAKSGGDLTVNADKVMIDGAAESVIDASDNAIIFNQVSGTATSDSSGTALTVRSDLTIKGGNTVTFHSYTQTGGTVATPGTGGQLRVMNTSAAATISGGTFAAEATFDGGAVFSGAAILKGTGQIITGGGTDKLFSFGAGTTIDLADGGLTLANVDKATIGGVIRFGGTAITANTLVADGKVELLTGSDIKLSADFARVVTASTTAGAANKLIETGTAGDLTTGLTGSELISDNFLLGRFTLTDDGQYLFVSDIDRLGLTLDGSSGDFALAERLLAERYGPGVGDGFAANIYKSIVDPVAPAPYDLLMPQAGIVVGSGSDAARSYETNLANLTAFAIGDRRADGSLAALYNGLNNSGVAEVAMATAEAVAERSRDRLRRIGEMRAALRESIGSDAALAAGILNSEHSNRLWLGGFGMWEDADANRGLDGYRYTSAGFVGGYDYACGPFSFGGAAAYTRGDFMDKTALRHDSRISSYSAILHGAYYAPDGAFVLGSGGYTYSRNDIRELRSDPSTAAGESWNTASYAAHTWRGSLEAGIDLQPTSCLNVTPSIGLSYVGVGHADHHERLGGVVVGKVVDADAHGVYLPLRLEIGYDVATGAESRLKLTARGGYAYAFNRDGIDGDFVLSGFSNAAVHKMVDRERGRHLYGGGVGFRFVTGQFDIGMNYDYSGRANYSAHHFTATAGFRF